MKKTLKDKLSDKLVNAFLKNKIISAIPKKFTKKLTEADKFRKLCESKIKEPVIGYKALYPITGSLILLSHSFLNLSASVSFFVNFLGIAEIILFFKKALTNLSESLSFNVFFIRLFYFNTDIGSSLV